MQVSCCSYAEQAGQLAAVDDQEAEERRRALGGELGRGKSRRVNEED